MTKRHIDIKKEPLKWACNHAFYAARSITPKIAGDKFLAFSAGAIAGYGAGCVGENIVHPYALEPVTGVSLDTTTKSSLAITVGGATIPWVVAPKQTREWAQGNKRYSSGVLGVMTGASLKAIVELL